MKLPATSVNRAFHLARVFVSEVPASFRKVGQRYKEKSSQVAHPSFFSESSLEKKAFLVYVMAIIHRPIFYVVWSIQETQAI